MAGAGEGFPRRVRIQRAEDFRRAFREGRRFPSGPFTIVVRENHLGHARLGLAISRRHARRATARSRRRRLVRESFRRARCELPPVDVVVATRPGADAATNAQVFRALERAWRRIRAGGTGG